MFQLRIKEFFLKCFSSLNKFSDINGSEKLLHT